MKRARESDSKAVTERYSAILRTAETLFGERGYHALSIDDVAEAAGVSKGLVYYHFASKKALVEQILKDAMESLGAELDAIAQSGESGQAKLRAAIAACLEMFNSRPYLVRIAYFGVNFEVEMKDVLAEVSEPTVVRLETLVKEGIAAGEFRPVHSRTAASMLLAMSAGPALQATLRQERLAVRRQLADDIADLFCQGICR